MLHSISKYLLILFCASFCVFASFCACSRSFAETFAGKVIAVTDGDTIKVVHDGNIEKIRLSDIDCPEKSQPFGNQAKNFTSSMVFGNTVIIHSRGTDRYERTIGDVLLPNGTDLNRALVKNGFAWWYQRYSKDESYRQLEASARNQRIGLWQDVNPLPPWIYRKMEAANRSRNKQPAISRR
jgi:endonuclease YncB( thermonuclease family)